MDGPPDNLQPLEFDTSKHPLRHRFVGWCEILSRKLLRVEGSTDREQPYWASASLRILPQLRTGTGVFAPSHYNRPRTLASSDSDDFVLMVNRGGGFAVNHRNREIGLEAGEAYLMACEEPGSYTRTSAGPLTCVRVGRDVLARAIPHVEDQTGHRIACDTNGLKLLLQYVQFLEDNAMSDPQVLALATDHVHDLLALVLGAAGEARELAGKRGMRAAQLASIKAHVERNLARTDLSPEMLAGQFGLSARKIQRLFECEGTTFTAFLREHRLQRVHRMLASPRHDAMTITEIALACGFGDVSHFNRHFRARFGTSPRDVRTNKSC